MTDGRTGTARYFRDNPLAFCDLFAQYDSVLYFCRYRKGNIMVKVMKTLGRILLATVIVVSIILFCAVQFIGSRNLSPIIESIANDYIDGHLKVGSVKIGFHPRFPILGVEVDDLSLISHTFHSLTADEQGLLPAYADSLLTLDHMTGSLDIKRLILDKELSLHDVVLRGLSVNLVISHNGKANYELVKLTPDTVKNEKSGITGFRINKFALEDPKEMRFFNASDSTSASVLLLADAAVDGEQQPTYRLKLNGNVTSRKATLITNLDQITFGLNGKVYWDPARPGLVAMEEMELQGAFLRAIVTGEIDLTDSPVVKKAIVEIPPVTLTDLLGMVPDSIRREHQLFAPSFSSDVRIGGHFQLTRPLNLATDTFPASLITLSVPPSTLRYGKAHFNELALDVTVNTVANQPDSTIIDITRCVVAGDKARFEASARLSTLFSDPTFAAEMQGEIDLANLPPVIHEKIHGYLAGIISTDLQARGSVSMFSRRHFHHLEADGYLTARNFYFLTGDIDKMVQINKARIDFSSDKLIGDMPLLSAKLVTDTANILLGGVDLSVGSLTLDAGMEGKINPRDTTVMMPVGGNLKVKRFNIISITDSAGARIRDLEGHILLSGSKKDSHLPELSADLLTGYVSAGSLSDRILLDNTSIEAILQKLPAGKKQGANIRNAYRTRHEYHYISPDSVIRHAYLKRHHRPGEKRTRRVYGALSANNEEVLEWDLAKGFNKFLTEWKLNGSLTTSKARLLTPHFPLRNRFSQIDLRFNNDTVNISDISLRAGKSDIHLAGLVSNVKRALTSKSDNTLKMNFALMSDTIDVNELSAGAFKGAVYAKHKRHGKIRLKGLDDAALEARLAVLAKEDTGSSAPILLPVNIDANIRIEAHNVLYSDLVMQNLGGDIMMYDGGVNLHDMKARSDAGNLSVSALYSAPNTDDMYFGFGMQLEDFNIGKFVKLVPAVDSIIPLIHDFSGTIGADIAATCNVDSGMNIMLPTLDAAIKITGDNLAFIDPHTYRTLGKWLGFKNKADNTIRHLNVEMTVADGLLQVYPFTFNIDRYRLGIYGYNDIAMNFDYHISILKSPLPFKFGITISGNPKKHKVRFGGAKFNETTAIESVNVVSNARINLIDQIENVFRRGVQNSRFSKLDITYPAGYEAPVDTSLNATDSLRLIQEGIIDSPNRSVTPAPAKKPKKKHKKFLFF